MSVPYATVYGEAAGELIREHDQLRGSGLLMVLPVADEEQARKVAAAAAAVLVQPSSETEIEAALWHEFGMLTCADVAGLADVSLSEPLSWVKGGRALGTRAGAVELLYGFQFDDLGQPFDSIAACRAALPGWSDEKLARWFVSRNAHLSGSRPVDLLGRDEAAIVSAARNASGQ